MWPASLITAGATAFGRLFAVGILPSTVLTTAVWLVLRADAFRRSGLSAADLIPADFDIGKGGLVLLFLLVVILLTAVVQSFHFAAIRMLEGYWGDSRAAVLLVRIGVSRHRKRLEQARERVGEARAAPASAAKASLVGPSPPLEEQIVVRRALARQQARAAGAWRRLSQYPPSQYDLLPTQLGNTLRAGERRAGERYGWETIDAWPRLYVGLPEPVAIAYRSAVDAVDTAAVFCLTFLTVSVFTAAAFLDDPALWWIPVAGFLLSYVSYRGAVASAVTQGILQQVAFDRHRFDLLEALHQPLPATPEEELTQARLISDFFGEPSPEAARAYRGGLRYSHAQPQHRPLIGWLRKRLGIW
jgi:hypothetical protein